MKAEASSTQTPGSALPVVLCASSHTTTSNVGTPSSWARWMTSMDW